MGRLRNKTTLITGGTSGIGLATARRFLGEGARVAITGSSAASIEQARAALGSAALILRSDAGNVAAQKELVGAVGEAFGKLDAVFINAGVSEFRPLEQWDEAGFDRTLAVNLKGPLFLVQALLPILNNPASIVLNTSINARIGMPNSSVYAASKAALISLARTLSGELIGRGVRVNAVSPGPIATPLSGKLGLAKADVEAMSAALLKQIPAGRFGNPSEIADAVVFLASDESEFIVGSEFIIDGGMSNI